MNSIRRLNYLFGVIGLVLGLYGGVRFITALSQWPLSVPLERHPWVVALLTSVAAGLVGLLLGPHTVRKVKQLADWLQGRLVRLPALDMVAGAFGLIVGLIIGYLLRPVLLPLPIVGLYLPAAASLLLGYLGWVVAVNKRDDILGIFSALQVRREKDYSEGAPCKILDTSAIIDGRIADICKAGFIDGVLVIPSFVLDELRHVADSSDVLKRNRGRRGLDVLNRMQKELGLPVRIYDKDPGGNEVDVKIVRLAKKLNGKIVTNDFNLNKVAALHGVQVLNVNELANAVKPLVIPGEDMVVQVLKEGKEAGQGVGYLDDGTMIVVEGGKRFIGDKVWVEVTSVLQTAAGRMIFAKPKQMSDVKATATHN